MGASSDAVAKAVSAYPDLRPYLPFGADLPDVRTLEDFVGELERAEAGAGNAYRKLVAMADAGLDKQSDYLVYAELQNAIYKAQLSAIGLVIAVANSATGGVAGIALVPLLTPPSPMPLLTWSGRHESQALRGLGLAPLAVAGVILAALAALGLMYLYTAEIAHIVDDLTTVYVAHARARQQTELLEARRIAFEACAARGGGETDCRAEALDLAPTPREAGTEVPDLPGSRSSGWTWGEIGLAVAGGVVVVAVLGGLFIVVRQGWRTSYGFGGYHNVPVSRVGPLPKPAPDLHGRSSYNLEVRRSR